MEESQAEISKERAEENIVTEAEKDNNSKLPMVGDAGKDNWESHQEDQTNRSHDDESAEVDAEIVEENKHSGISACAGRSNLRKRNL